MPNQAEATLTSKVLGDDGSDWQRCGRRGGLATLRRYGTSWYSALALKRWGRLDAEDLEHALMTAKPTGRGVIPPVHGAKLLM